MPYCDYITKKNVICNKKIKNGYRCAVHKEKNEIIKRTNIIDLPEQILLNIIDKNIENIKTETNRLKVYDIIKSTIYLLSSCKTLYNLYDLSYWDKIWNYYTILNEVQIKDNNIGSKLKTILHIERGCQNCKIPKIRKIYEGLNVRYCEKCLNTETIRDYILKDDFNIDIRNYNLPYHTKYYYNPSIRWGNNYFEYNLYLKRDIEEKVLFMKIDDYIKNKNYVLVEELNLNYDLVNKNEFIECIWNEKCILKKDTIKNKYNEIYKKNKIDNLNKYIIENNTTSLSLENIKETEIYKNLHYNIRILNYKKYIDFDKINNEYNEKLFIQNFKKFYEKYISCPNFYQYNINVLKDIFHKKILTKNEDILKEMTLLYKCNLCENIYDDRNKLNSHRIRHTDIKCEICNKILKSCKGLVDHTKSKHGISLK